MLAFAAKALDEYAAVRSKPVKPSDEDVKIDPRLEAIVERMLDKYDLKFQLNKKYMGYLLSKISNYSEVAESPRDFCISS